MSDYLLHAKYASPYYDPVKAHEYYMKHRQLVGRKSTSGLNDEGRAAAKYVKQQIDDARKQRIKAHSDQTNAKIKSNNEATRASIKRNNERTNSRNRIPKEQGLRLNGIRKKRLRESNRTL